MSSIPRTVRCLGLGLVLLAAGRAVAAPAVDAEWITVDYADLVDRRVLSHSGEPVGVLLDRLGGRPLPPPGERADDRLAHALLDPLLEPYAFVLSDALDALGPVADPPLVEIAGLFLPGERQPAWNELLRARRYVVESDGRGRLRLILPAIESAGPPGTASRDAARAAFEHAWPVMRHVLAAEIRRLSAGSAGPASLEVRVHAYRHDLARTRFLLGARPYETKISDTRPDGRRPPLDLSALESFLRSGLVLEGGRLEPDGTLRLLGSPASHPPTLAGRPLAASDFAVAYRAVFHGGLSEPYMSLDRGYSPHVSIVNYGGRLRDTLPGLVSLLCDIRFKTFSLGIDIATARDVREEVRGRIPGFRTHLERFAADPGSAGIQAQQTRLWFYPDSVDLTLSAQGDVLAMRRVRMSAASERVAASTMTAAAGEDPPWTRATVAAINHDYDGLASFFPELDDLDQVVRLLSLFTWLRQAEQAGLPVPELDTLLALELPETYTPRRFPQLLTFNALPAAGAAGAVASFDRVAVGQALDALDPRGTRPLPARSRLERALAALDRADPQHAAFADELAGRDLAALDETALDLLTYRAERLRMHRLVLSTLDRERSAGLAARQQGGEELRIFSVGIGGLDLGMGQALARAEGHSLQLGLVGGGTPRGTARPAPAVAVADAGAPRDAWREDRGSLPATALPAHGARADGAGSARHFVEVRALAPEPGAPGPVARTRVSVVLGAQDEEVRARTLYLDEGRRAVRVERLESSRLLHFRFDPQRDALAARLLPPMPVAAPAPAPAAGALPAGLVRLRFGARSGAAGGAVRLRLEFARDGEPRQLEADFPSAVLQRLVMGREVDQAAAQPLPLAPLPPVLGQVEGVMFQLEPWHALAPWEAARPPVPGEEDPERVARALNRWSAEGPADQAAAPAVVGTDAEASPRRWADAPRPEGAATLVLPSAAFTGAAGALRDELARRFRAGPVVDALPAAIETGLVVVVSSEPPGACAARLSDLALDPRMADKLLALWCLSGEIRPDLPASIVARGRLAGLGLASSDFVDVRTAARSLEAFADALASPISASSRVEQIAGPFLWYF